MKKVLFDFGNVLGFFDHNLSCARLAPSSDVHDPITFKKILFDDKHAELERGKISPIEFYSHIVEKTGLRLSFDEFSGVYADIFSEVPGIEEVVSLVPERSRFLLSNTDPFHWERIRLLPVIANYFGRSRKNIRSFDTGARKPEGAIFVEAIRRTGVPVSEVVYVDDVPEYVQAFKKLGGTAFAFNARKEPLTRLRSRLEESGAIP